MNCGVIFTHLRKKFKDAVEDQQKQKSENERLKRMQEFWMREGHAKSKRDLAETDQKKEGFSEDTEALGIMDKLISSIKQGHFVL